MRAATAWPQFGLREPPVELESERSGRFELSGNRVTRR